MKPYRRSLGLICLLLISGCGGGGGTNESARSSSSAGASLSRQSSSSLSVESSSSSSTSSSTSSVMSSSSSSSLLAPQDIAVIAGNSELDVSWTAAEGASGYTIYYAKESLLTLDSIANYTNLAGAGRLANISQTQSTIIGLDNNQLYFVVVTAIGDIESEISVEKSAVPSAPPAAGDGIACTLKIDGGYCDDFVPMTNGGKTYSLANLNAPGKTYCMQPVDTAKGMSISDVTGSEGNPVKIVNCDSKVTLNSVGWQRGINVTNSQFIHISGTGSREDFYGIHVINSEGAGADATNGTSDFEIDHVRIDNAGGSGILVRTYPFGTECHLEWTRSQFTQFNTKVHDNHVNGARWEGLYIGTSHYDLPDGPSGTNCGINSAPQASLVGVEIYNNKIENTGNDGIQLGAAITDVKVYNNTIRNYALHNSGSHGGGLQLNPGTGGQFYNNFVQAHPDSTEAKGLMYIGGQAPLYVYNNVFVGGDKAIMTLNRMPNSTQFYFTNNTFYGRGTGNVFYFFCNLLPEMQTYTFKNNIFTHYESIGSDQSGGWNYFNGAQGAKCPMNGIEISGYADNEEDLHMTENYFSKTPDDILFVSPPTGDYSLQGGSPAAGFGADLSVTIPSPSN